MIATNTFLLGIDRDEEAEFKPSEIINAFDAQLAHRQGIPDDVIFLPPPDKEDAVLIVEESKAMIAEIVEKRGLDPDVEVEDEQAKQELITAVRTHLDKFAW